MKTALEDLSAAGAEFYADAAQAGKTADAATGGAPAAASAAGGREKSEKKADVVDADFEVVDEDKG